MVRASIAYASISHLQQPKSSFRESRGSDRPGSQPALVNVGVIHSENITNSGRKSHFTTARNYLHRSGRKVLHLSGRKIHRRSGPKGPSSAASTSSSGLDRPYSRSAHVPSAPGDFRSDPGREQPATYHDAAAQC